MGVRCLFDMSVSHCLAQVSFPGRRLFMISATGDALNKRLS